MTKYYNTNTNIPAVPQFPVAPANYSQDQMNQLNNSLRLYLNQLNSTVSTNIEAIQSNNVLTWLNL